MRENEAAFQWLFALIFAGTIFSLFLAVDFRRGFGRFFAPFEKGY
jgi:hypothetical protein